MTNPYFAKANDEKAKISEILDDPSLTNPQKEIEYGQAMNNYSQYMAKAEPVQTTLFPPINKSQPARKPTSTITKPTTSEDDYWGTLDDIENLPYEPREDEEFKANLKAVRDLPLLEDADYEEDSGDEKHMENFVSLSDDENTVEEKRSRAEYNFRKRVRNKKERKKRSKPYEKDVE